MFCIDLVSAVNYIGIMNVTSAGSVIIVILKNNNNIYCNNNTGHNLYYFDSNVPETIYIF